jgi:hypothetical protein
VPVPPDIHLLESEFASEPTQETAVRLVLEYRPAPDAPRVDNRVAEGGGLAWRDGSGWAVFERGGQLFACALEDARAESMPLTEGIVRQRMVTLKRQCEVPERAREFRAWAAVLEEVLKRRAGVLP